MHDNQRIFHIIHTKFQPWFQHKNCTMRACAMRLNVSHTSIYPIVRGEIAINGHMVFLLSSYFGCKPGDISDIDELCVYQVTADDLRILKLTDVGEKVADPRYWKRPATEDALLYFHHSLKQRKALHEKELAMDEADEAFLTRYAAQMGVSLNGRRLRSSFYRTDAEKMQDRMAEAEGGESDRKGPDG